MTLYSQLDSRWKNELLGFSSVTIGGYGCTITSIGMLLDETPSSVNVRMKAVGGFADKNLVIWEKIKEAFPEKVESVRRVWSYSNDDVKANIPCVVQVDGTPIGAPMHFVVYVGNQKLYDPWGGVERATSYYVPQSYCVIKLKQPPMDDCPAKLKQVTEERDRLNKVIEGKDKQIEALKTTNTTLSTENIKLTSDLEAEKEHAKVTLDTELGKQRELLLTESINERKALEQDFEKKLEEARKENPVKIVERETALSVRFQHKPIKERIKAIVDILLA